MLKRKKILIPAAALAVVIVVSVGLFFGAAKDLSATDRIENYTKGKSDVLLTIGLYKNGQSDFRVFGAEASELEPVEYQYEIGSVSKTFTASILCKAVADGRVNLEDPISVYLPLKPETFAPTLLSLATHTSGYGEYPFDDSVLSEEEREAIETDFYEKRSNIYQGIDRDVLLDEIQSFEPKGDTDGWAYSNFGMAVLGLAVSEAYDTTYKKLAEDFIQNDLGLTETRIGDGTGDLSDYWEWNEDDTYSAAGGIVSTVTDLLKYGQFHLTDSPDCLALSHKTWKTEDEEGIGMGLGWIIDPETGYLWHNGATSSYTSFLGIDKKHRTVVVILSNSPIGVNGEEEDALDLLGFSLLAALSKEDYDFRTFLSE